MLVWEINCVGRMWQWTRTFLCSSYEPMLHIYQKYLSSVAVNQEHWQLEALFLVQSSPPGGVRQASCVSIKQLWPLRGSEASIQSTSMVDQGHQQHDPSAQRQHNSTRTRGSFPNSLHCCHKRQTQGNIILNFRSKRWLNQSGLVRMRKRRLIKRRAGKTQQITSNLHINLAS